MSSLSKNTFFLKEKYGKKWRGVTTKKCQLSPAPTGFSISMVRCRERTILQKKIFVFSKIFFIIFYRLIYFCCGQVVEPLSTFCGYVCQNFVFFMPKLLRIPYLSHFESSTMSIIQIQRNITKKTGFFKEQNAGFIAKIHRVSLTKTWFLKKGILSEI